MMCNFVFPLHLSEATGMYQNAFGEFSLETSQKNGSFEFYLTEEKSGLFRLERVDGDKLRNTRHMEILCPHDCMHKLITKDGHISSVQNATLDLHYNTFLRRILLW